MNFSLVQQAINNLPLTFKRDGTPYTQWVDSESAELTRYTSAVDVLMAQVQAFANARYGWLDFWGLLFGIARMLNQADSRYSQLISYTVNAGAGPPVAIALWIKIVWNVDATVTENFPGVGYSISFAQALTDDQIAQILGSLGRIRPAGVPILAVGNSNSGLYLTTVNFINAPSVTGGYLTGVNSGASANGIAVSTNNAAPLLPDLFLTDSTLNSGL